MSAPGPSTITLAGDRITRISSSDGVELLLAVWNDDGLERLRFRGPDRAWLELVVGRGEHPILGPCDGVRIVGDPDPLVFCGRVNWARPERIPSLDRPQALPVGAGTGLLNALAIFARHAGCSSLRYHGPYPTVALFDTLLGSFRVAGDVAPARACFSQDAEGVALMGRAVSPEVDFEPDPHDWTFPTAELCVQSRRGIERVYIEGHVFTRDTGIRRLVPQDDGDLVAELMLAERPCCELLRLDARGRPRGPIQPLPPAPADLVGVPLPSEVGPPLVEAIAASSASLLAPALRQVLSERPLIWGDAGLALVRATDDAIVLHAAMVSHLPEDPVALLAVMEELLGATLRRLAQQHLADAYETMLRR